MGKTEKKRPLGAGKSSFELIDAEKVFGEIGLRRGSTFLDMACGLGRYAIAASKIVGDEGLIYAVDLWEKGIDALQEEASAKGIKNLKASVSDVGKTLPIPDHQVDICLMATVLHDLVQTRDDEGALKEARRVLNTQGSLAIVEFKKIDGPPGPPIGVRLTPDDVEGILLPHGFRKKQFVEVGPYNYLMIFDVNL
ncbi:MAG: methyltransferase domain-containing protein [Proteobacteria bacterium]|nr:methyltransferase domain-containing protein [Pseudomonadota bacterium]NIS67728.1 methyltransferase domain-containing protein [Pseudomonadota bacterium]